MQSELNELLTVGAIVVVVIMLVQFTLFGPPIMALAVTGLFLSTVGLVSFRSQRQEVKTLQTRAETVEGTVTAADQGIRNQIGPYGNNWNCYPEIAVEYRYGGRQYTTETVYAGDGRVRFRPDDMQRFLDDYEKGATTTVYVDPDDHSRAYLEPHPGFKWWEGPVAVYAVGIVVGLWGVLLSPLTP